MRGARTFALAALAAAAVPASAAADRTAYSVVKAHGYQQLEFSSDPATCERFGVCGESGTVRHAFGGRPRGRLVLNRSGRRQAGRAGFRSRATTSARASGPSGSCRDEVRRRREWFSLRGSIRRLRFDLHPGGTRRDYLRTDCPGPSERALRRVHALPRGTFAAHNFHNARTLFGLDGTSVFRTGGYRGTVTWRLRYVVARR